MIRTRKLELEIASSRSLPRSAGLLAMTLQLPYLHCHCEPDKGGRGNLPIED